MAVPFFLSHRPINTLLLCANFLIAFTYGWRRRRRLDKQSTLASRPPPPPPRQRRKKRLAQESSYNVLNFHRKLTLCTQIQTFDLSLSLLKATLLCNARFMNYLPSDPLPSVLVRSSVPSVSNQAPKALKSWQPRWDGERSERRGRERSSLDSQPARAENETLKSWLFSSLLLITTLPLCMHEITRRKMSDREMESLVWPGVTRYDLVDIWSLLCVSGVMG